MRAFALALVCAVLATPALAGHYNPYDPKDLVARAREAIAADDLAVACVLLSRASTLAPHDARVWLAWRDYEAAQGGMPVRSSAPAQPATSEPDTRAKSPGPIPPQPPALWPAR
jgi:hypothetical protein